MEESIIAKADVGILLLTYRVASHQCIRNAIIDRPSATFSLLTSETTVVPICPLVLHNVEKRGVISATTKAR